MTDQRHYQRIPFCTKVDLLLEDRQLTCDLVDLALRGVLIKASETISLPIGKRAHIRINLSESDLNLTFGGELIHRKDNLYGFLFVDADDESLTHLRRLLELNLGDDEEVERELIHWLQHPRH